MSELSKFLESKGLEVTKDSIDYVRVKVEAVSNEVLTNTIDLAEAYPIDKDKSFFDLNSNQLFLYHKIKPIETVKEVIDGTIEEVVEEIEEEAVEEVEVVVVEEAIEVEEPEEEIPEDVKDIAENLE